MKTILKTTVISILVLSLFSLPGYAGNGLRDEIKTVISSPSPTADLQIEKLITAFITLAKEENIVTNREILLSEISKSNLKNKKEFHYEIEALYAKRLLKPEEARYYMLKALDEIPQEKPKSISMLTTLAVIDTDLENYIQAMENYLLIQKQLQQTHDTNKLILNYTNIASLYIKSNLFEEAIKTLDIAHELALEQDLPHIPNILYENKAVAYFHLKNMDSLQHYAAKIADAGSPDQLADHRMKYMILLLQNDKEAIREIKILADSPADTDKLYTYLHLAEAYLIFNETRKAKEVIFKLLHAPDLKNLSYLRAKLFSLLGNAYLEEKQFRLSAQYYKKGTDQSASNTLKMIKTGSILNLLKYDEITKKYVRAQEHLEVRQNYLFLFIVVAGMIIMTFIFLYRSLKIKKKYDELMFNKLSSEISFINSHEIRKYLSNILGIVMVIKMSENRNETYFEFEDALFDSAENLDTSIKSIAAKLNDKAESCT
jgi:tetratricopeptide (TPR) repeat protein